ANEKANIYGLQLYDNKKISFSKIDPQKAKEIFIQQALVERSLKDDYNFLLHNNNLIDEVLEMENKIRKRDILVDENDIFNFYNNIFPDHVNSVKSLKDWLKNNDEKQIFLNLEK